ncbi:hypothetical protein CBR_g19146 [Chara braunii]|uniref:glycine--tRNA ligase n=1 Tax=Chara braunii TaxID=69332 RepID=A0A388KXE0_CHABU|nr:hypothetical protein CBR_g19146 [Chara braunii]|eukprot:GBG74740.1 hypothetical protein CBR_g19146 [Chara braunii]
MARNGVVMACRPGTGSGTMMASLRQVVLRRLPRVRGNLCCPETTRAAEPHVAFPCAQSRISLRTRTANTCMHDLSLGRRARSRLLYTANKAIADTIADRTATGVDDGVSTPEEGTREAKDVVQTTVPTFQQAIQRLQDYWASVGCAVVQPYNTEVGAGTMNPSTFLRVLGPEPWNIAYVEPSVRPDDSRYGENPNRVQQHTQFQVILKPEPGNPQELYLDSLAALGIDSKEHDIRFVEDNWESPVLGAWGLGWEVWMDGMEITQFTYFQQAGSMPVKPVAVEITYGLERILMALQGVDHFKKIQYATGITYGEIFLNNEKEMSTYNLDVASVERVQKLFDIYDEEAKAMLQAKLPIPAYNYLLKTSHVFNILDARGAIGVTERARYFGRMRKLARQCAGLWLETRQESSFPLGIADEPAPSDLSKGVVDSTEEATQTQKRMFVLEIGSEELPPQDVTSAVEQLGASVPELLSKLRLEHDHIVVEGTPRRLVVLVDNVATKQSDRLEEVRGPPLEKALGSDGKPTKAAEGFCKKNGVEWKDVTVKADARGVEYVHAVRKESGRPSIEVLAQELPRLISQISFPKTMRWSTDVSYSRPLRWIVALHGDKLIPFTYAGAVSGRISRVLRNSSSPTIQVEKAEDYRACIEEAGITLGMKERREHIWREANTLVALIGGRIPEKAKADLLEEVKNLVESPSPILGKFDETFLELPREVLVMVMRKHQRYFPVEDSKTGQLLPAFVTVANGQLNESLVRKGNEAVLRARYQDARFFYEADRLRPLASYRDSLSGITFQEKLGTMKDKMQRVEEIVANVGDDVGIPPATMETAKHAMQMAMADLATSMVVEFTALAGIMGRHYASKEGQPPEVAEALFEIRLPRFAGDTLPKSPVGILLAVADRLDSVVGLYAVGCGASATADPFSLRRSTYGLVQTLVENNLDWSLRKLLRTAAKAQPVHVSDETADEVWTFIVRRLEQLLVDRAFDVEIVRAILSEQGDTPALAAQSVQQVEESARNGELEKVIAAYARPTRIVRGKQIDVEWKVNDQLLVEDEEKQLWTAYQQVSANLHPGVSAGKFLKESLALIDPVDAFFENVFVMAEDEALQRNRLALLQGIASLPRGVVNFTLLPGF